MMNWDRGPISFMFNKCLNFEKRKTYHPKDKWAVVMKHRRPIIGPEMYGKVFFLTCRKIKTQIKSYTKISSLCLNPKIGPILHW